MSAGILFDIDCSQAHYWVHRLQPILGRATPPIWRNVFGGLLKIPVTKTTSNF